MYIQKQKNVRKIRTVLTIYISLMMMDIPYCKWTIEGYYSTFNIHKRNYWYVICLTCPILQLLPEWKVVYYNETWEKKKKNVNNLRPIIEYFYSILLTSDRCTRSDICFSLLSTADLFCAFMHTCLIINTSAIHILDLLFFL